MVWENKFIGDRLKKLLRRMDHVPSKNTLVFVDTGAFIDAEDEVSTWRLCENGANFDSLYNYLHNSGLRLFVTEANLNESYMQYRHNKINGHSIIRPEHFKIIEGYHEDYKTFLNSVKGNELDEEQIRLDTHWASLLAFENGHKKKDRDPISLADKALVYEAVKARYSLYPHKVFGIGGNEREEVCTPESVIILSPDAHLDGMTRILTNGDIGFERRQNYDGIKAVKSR